MAKNSRLKRGWKWTMTHLARVAKMNVMEKLIKALSLKRLRRHNTMRQKLWDISKTKVWSCKKNPTHVKYHIRQKYPGEHFKEIVSFMGNRAVRSRSFMTIYMATKFAHHK